MKSNRFLALSVCTLSLGFLASAPVEAVTRVVDDDGMATFTNCDAATPTPYTTISAAVAAAVNGDVIVVCPATYDEQVDVAKSITIRGFANEAIVIQPSPMVANSTSTFDATPVAAAVVVHDTTGVLLHNLIADGSTNGVADDGTRLHGFFWRNASGSMTHNTARHFRLAAGPPSGAQTGQGIMVQTTAGMSSNVTLTENSVHDYQKGGIVANELGSTINASYNVVSGDGTNDVIAQNGIQIAFDAGGSLTQNRIIKNRYGNPSTASTGILVYLAADGVVVNTNSVGDTQVGIYFQANMGTITSNNVMETHDYDGIAIVGNGNSVKGNTVTNSDEAAIFVDGTSNTVTSNRLHEAPIGILEVSGTNTVPLTGSGSNSCWNIVECYSNTDPIVVTSESESALSTSYAVQAVR